MGERKCIECGKQVSESDRLNHEYMYDEEGDLWCMPCAETESDTGEKYSVGS